MLLVLLLGVVYSLSALARASSWVEHTTEVELSLSRLLTALVDAETGQRGYLASGEARFLDTYENGRSRWRTEFERAKALTSDNPSQQMRLAKLEGAVTQKLDEMDATRSAYDRGARDGALASLMWTGKEQMLQIRTLVAECQGEEQRLALERQHDRVGHAQWTLFLLLASFLVLAFTIGVMWTARQKAEKRLAEQFVAILGHDLRNPLNAIALSASMLKRHDSDEKAVDRILSSAARMDEMIRQLLDLARGRLGGGIAIEPKQTTLTDVVVRVVDELQQAHPSREIRCTLAPNIRGDWDPDRLAQVVSNLVGNAIQYGDAERPIEVRLTAERDVMLEVQSFGPPISPDLLPVVFEPYRRGERRGKTAGLGLGLFISRQIVLAHHGRIDVTSTTESGTTFRVRLPRSAASERALVRAHASQSTSRT